MSEHLVIVGAGSFGFEVLQWAADAGMSVRGFLDDAPITEAPASVLGTTSDYPPRADVRCVIAIRRPAIRMRLADRLQKLGWQFGTVIHPTAVIGRGTSVGEGSIICPYAVATTNVEIGRHVVLNLHATLGHGARIGDGCTLSPHCDVTTGVTLGEGVLMGTHAAIMPKLTIGSYAVIGAGSTAIRNVQDLATVVGVPAKQIYGFEPILNEQWQP